MQIIWTDTEFNFIQKSKFLKYINVKCKTIKLLIEENLCDLEFGDNFFDTTPKAQSIKNFNKIGSIIIKIPNFCSEKYMVKKIKWEAAKGQAGVANEIGWPQGTFQESQNRHTKWPDSNNNRSKSNELHK